MLEVIEEYNMSLFNCDKIFINFLKTISLLAYIQIKNIPGKEKEAKEILNNIIVGHILENNMPC
jgi:hypothetical protein